MARLGVLGEGLDRGLLSRLYGLFGAGLAFPDVPPEGLGAYLEGREFRGLVLTGAYKEAALPFCHGLDPMAERLESANLLLADSQGRLTGCNTEYYAFAWMAKRAGVNMQGAKALLLGMGPSSRAAQAVAEDMGAGEVAAVSREGDADFTGAQVLHSDAEVIVNATSAGMYPDNGGAPIRLSGFRRCRGVLDMICNPLRTMLLLEAERRGIPCEGGLGMLVAEAKRNLELLTGTAIPEERIGQVCTQAMEDICNIVLIGMPGSGKSYFGGLIAKAFGRELVNMDDYIEETRGVRIPDVFARQGENAFREMEIQASRELGCRRGLVISAGGGTVVRRQSMDALRQNGCVFFVDRPLSELATDGRPLSQGSGAVQRLYDARIGLYTGYADVCILNTEGMTVANIADNVLREYEKVCAVASLPRWEQRL